MYLSFELYESQYPLQLYAHIFDIKTMEHIVIGTIIVRNRTEWNEMFCDIIFLNRKISQQLASYICSYT